MRLTALRQKQSFSVDINTSDNPDEYEDSIKKKLIEKILDTLKEEMYASNKDYRALCFDFGDEKDRYYILDENTFSYIKEILDKETI